MSSDPEFIEIAGDELEGGGQLTRISMCLSSLLNKPIHIVNIRGKRAKPGLQRQHLTGLTSVAALHRGYPQCLTGASMGSTEITFDPRKLTHSKLPFTVIEIGTAGSIGLIIQVILPCLLFYPYEDPSKRIPLNNDIKDISSEFEIEIEKTAAAAAAQSSEIKKSEFLPTISKECIERHVSNEREAKGFVDMKEVPCSPPSLMPLSVVNAQHTMIMKGGTDVSWAPSTSYLETVLSPLLSKHMNIKMRVETIRHGFYPKGNGEAKLTVTTLRKGETITPITLTERGEVESISIKAFISRVPKNIGDKLVRITLEKLKEELIHLPLRVDVQVYDVTSTSFGSGVWLEITAKTNTGCKLWASSMGAFKKPSEEVAKEAVDVFVKDLNAGGCVDEFTQDQLLVFMALAKGKSVVRTGEISLHSRTAMEIIKKIAGVEFSVVNEGSSNVISCTGLGYCN